MSNARRIKNNKTSLKPARQTNVTELAEEIMCRIADLSKSADIDLLFYKKFGFAQCINVMSTDIPPVKKEAQTGKQVSSRTWEDFRANRSALIIQTVWKRSVGKIGLQLPPLNQFFKMGISDYQKAEFISLHTISDDILHSLVEQVIGMNEKKENNDDQIDNEEEEEEENEEEEVFEGKDM